MEKNIFDIILLFSSIQRCIPYLIICKQLSPKYKIGIYSLQRSIKENIRSKNNVNFAIETCKKFGAKEISNSGKYKTKILLHAQSPYRDVDKKFIKDQILSDIKIGLSGVTNGNKCFGELPYELDHIFVPDIKIYKFLIEKFSNSGIDLSNKIIEVGSPFNKYNFHKAPQIDFLIAGPTPFSFLSKFESIKFLKRLNNLIAELFKENKNLKIIYKPHNADERFDYFIYPKIYEKIKNLPNILLHFINFILIPYLNLSELILFKKNILDEIISSIEYSFLMQKVTHISDFSKYGSLNIESFIPYVKKGVITGRSNTIWHCLYQKVPVWNLIEKEKNYLTNKKLHELIMKYLNIHFDTDLSFEKAKFSKIDDKTRNRDIIKTIETILNKK